MKATVTPEAENAIADIAQRYGLSRESVLAMLFAVNAGGGTMAQFSIPELGGSGQWMRGGMTMVGNMFDNALKARVDALCSELAQLLATTPVFPASSTDYQVGFTSASWWPGDLGVPSASGGQNDARYAIFPSTQRLAIQINGVTKVFDTGKHQIGGVQQQQDGRYGSASFTSQFGTFDVSSPARLLTIADRVHPMVVRAALSGTGRMLYGTGIAFSSDGRTLAAAGAGGTVRLWNVIDPTHPVELGAPLPGGSRVTYAVAFSETRNLLVSAGGDTVLRLWGLADLAHPTLLAQPVTAPGGSILSVAVSPDGDTVAAANADDTVTLWNISDPTHPIPLGKPLTGHTRGVGAVMFSPDGRTLVTGSADSTVRLWALPPTRLVGSAGDLTPQVWTTYVSRDRRYDPPCGGA